MRPTPPIDFILGLLWCGLGLVPSAVHATPEPVATEERASPAALALWVEVVPGPAQLEPEVIRAAVEQELGLVAHADPGRPYVGKVTIEGLSGPAVSVRYESKDGTTSLERRLALPVDPVRRSVVVSWVVGNLVRNEAAEILSGMTKRSAVDLPDNVTNASAPVPVETLEPADTAPPAVITEQPKAPPASPGATVTTSTASANSPALEPRLGPARVINLAFLSPAVALHRDAAQHAYHLSLGGVYSRIGALRGVGFTLLVDRVEQQTNGTLVSGIWSQTNDSTGFLAAGVGTQSSANLVGTELSGVVTLRTGCVVGAQITGVWATAGESCEALQLGKLRFDGMAMLGLQMAGLVARVKHGFRGAQIAGGVSIANARYEGAQLTLGAAFAKGGFQGAQLAGLGNFSGGTSRGLQFALGLNHHAGDMNGAQLSIGANIAQDVRGMQFGSLNVARDVRGLQLGLVNIARENHGLALGLFNWSKQARLQPTYFFQTPGYHALGYRNLSGRSLGTISYGYDPVRDRARTRFGIGVRQEIERVALGLELGYGWVLDKFSSERTDRAHELDLIGTATLEIVKDVVSIYGGGGATLPVAGVVPIKPSGLAQAGISVL